MKSIKKFLAVTLALLILVTSLAACSSKGEALLTLDGEELSVNMFCLYLSRMKGNLASSYSFGSAALTDDFWDTIMDTSSGQTYNDYYTSMVLENAKSYLAALCLFEERGLELPDSYIDEIDAELDRLIEEEADGSKNTFNSMLATYGVNYKILREAYIIEAKIAYLREDLFGKDGSKIASELVENYYNKTYRRFKQIFFYTYDFVYETDENGDDIYYTDSGKIAYDTSKTVKKDADDKVVTDKNGDTVYVTDDGKIAYDTDAGTRKNVLDTSGNNLVEDMTADEIKLVVDRANGVMAQTVTGDTLIFDALVKDEAIGNEDTGMETYPNGYYMTAQTEYDSPEVVKALFEMEVGEVRMIRSDYGIHIVMRYENEKGGYTLDENSDFFISTTGSGYIFQNDLINTLFSEYVEKYKLRITVNEAALEGVDMKSVGANYHY